MRKLSLAGFPYLRLDHILPVLKNNSEKSTKNPDVRRGVAGGLEVGSLLRGKL